MAIIFILKNEYFLILVDLIDWLWFLEYVSNSLAIAPTKKVSVSIVSCLCWSYFRSEQSHAIFLSAFSYAFSIFRIDLPRFPPPPKLSIHVCARCFLFSDSWPIPIENDLMQIDRNLRVPSLTKYFSPVLICVLGFFSVTTHSTSLDLYNPFVTVL